jgi:hypothetical protein
MTHNMTHTEEPTMTTTDTERAVPAWLNLDAVHPPEALADLPNAQADARALAEQAAEFNRRWGQYLRDYADRSTLLPDGDAHEIVDELTGYETIMELTMLARTLIGSTAVAGEPTEHYAAALAERHSDIADGCRRFDLLKVVPVTSTDHALSPEARAMLAELEGQES